ncbi:unnamed protein product [Clonostachys rosea f. rosea IK726]|uniref:Acid phosphatase n=2 Tax=Bionectria ochroleuca TaxID=29856 RepID=A0A0B7JLU3_BIOOC|nr:unnamed protein product [Clonostachys rosea f. rosea IK726]
MLPSGLTGALWAMAITPLVFAQTQKDNTRVWAVIAYVHHGESVPELTTRPAVLTPEGAQQMARQGAAFRSRYLNETSSSGGNSTTNSTGLAPIYDMQLAALDNSKLTVMAAEEEASVGSALAFLQGLYPPVTQEYSILAGGDEIAHNFARNSSGLVDYPLGGYQYPKLQVPATSDRNSPSIQGNVGCTKWTAATNSILRQRQDMKDLYDESASLYRNLFASGPLKSAVTNETANFWNAYEIYDYVNYLYLHNETTHDGLDNANETLMNLKSYAYAIQRGKYTESVDETDDAKNQLYTVAGRTLASKIVSQFENVIANSAKQNKLTLMFGSLEPMLSFFSISGLINRENVRSGAFSSLPEPGSAMIFELVGDVPRKYETNLDPEKLQIRFRYRASADEGEEFADYALFNSGYGASTVSYTTFSRQLSSKSVNSTEWCDVCGSTTSSWCGLSSTSDGTDSSGMFTRKQSIHPAIAGVIGALVMAAVMGLVVLALYMVAGFRLRRAGEDERKRTFGGFKREEKKPSDTDVNVTQEGMHHERVGSWELRGHESPIPGLGGVITKNFSRSVTRRIDDDDDDQISILGAKPAAVREAL